MPIQFSGNPIWREFVTGPDNADPATGESVTDMGVLLADRDKYLLQQIEIAGWWRQPMNILFNEDSRFEFNPSVFGWTQSDVTSIGNLIIPTVLPPRGLIQKLGIMRTGDISGTPHAGLPTIKPLYRLSVLQPLDTAFGLLVNASDPATTLGEYETPEFLEFSLATPFEISEHDVYVLQIFGEGGDNAAADKLHIYSASILVEPFVPEES